MILLCYGLCKFHFNTGCHYGFLFLIICSTSFYNGPSIFQGEVFFSIPFILLIIYRYTYNQIIGFMFPAILSICIVTSIKFFLNKHKLKVIAIGVIVFLIFAFLCNSFIHDTQMVHVYCCMVLALLCWGLDILVRKMP